MMRVRLRAIAWTKTCLRAAVRVAAVAALAGALALAGACATAGLPQGAVSFRVEGNVNDATVWIDDQLIGTVSEWSKPNRHIRAGFHRVEVRHPGYYSFFQEIELPEGQSVVVHAELRELIQ